MQDVEFAERHAAGAHLLHGALVLAAPGVGKFGPIEVIATRLKDRFRFTRDRGAPIHQRAENVEEEGFHDGQHRINFLGT